MPSRRTPRYACFGICRCLSTWRCISILFFSTCLWNAISCCRTPSCIPAVFFTEKGWALHMDFLRVLQLLSDEFEHVPRYYWLVVVPDVVLRYLSLVHLHFLCEVVNDEWLLQQGVSDAFLVCQYCSDGPLVPSVLASERPDAERGELVGDYIDTFSVKENME